MRRKLLLLIPLALIVCGSSFAQAKQTLERTTGLGVMSPSRSYALVRNPAGIHVPSNTAVRFGIDSTGNDLTPMNWSAHFHSSKKSFSFGAGIRSTELQDFGHLGLGFLIKGLNTVLAVSGSYIISGSTGVGKDYDVYAGLLINPDGNFQASFAAISIMDNVDAYGLGVQFAFFQSFDLVFELMFDGDLEISGFIPSLKTDSGKLGVSFGFGFEDSDPLVAATPNPYFVDGIVLSIAYQIASKMLFKYEYLSVNTHQVEFVVEL